MKGVIVGVLLFMCLLIIYVYVLCGIGHGMYVWEVEKAQGKSGKNIPNLFWYIWLWPLFFVYGVLMALNPPEKNKTYDD
jgi:hypothetical protein